MAKGNDIQSVGIDLLSEGDSGSNISVVTPDDGWILIENSELLFHGDYERQGSDLLISHGGESQLVIGYFGTSKPAHLESTNGAILTAKVVSALAGDPTAGQYAQAGGAAGPLEIGKVVKLEGTASGTSEGGQAIDLKVGSPVYQGDVIQTGPDSTLGISFVDETVFSMSADARMILDELIYDPANVENSSMAFNLVQGAFVFVTGEIAPSGNMNIQTPVATMGIRGTTIRSLVKTDQGVEEHSLLPDPGSGNVGQFNIYNKQTGELLGTVKNLVDKYVVTALGGQATIIQKSAIDKLDELDAIDQITEIWNIAQRDFTELDGSNSFGVIVVPVNDGGGDGGGFDGDGGDGGGATGPVEATGVTPDAPPVAIDDLFATNAQVSIPELLFDGTLVGTNGNDYDNEGLVVATQVNGVPLEFTDGTNSYGAYDEVFLPSGAKIHVNADGHVEYFPNPAYNFLGRGDVDINTFSYVISDNVGQLDQGEVFVTVTGRNQTAVLTNGDSGELDDTYSEPSGTNNIDPGTSNPTTQLAGQGFVRFVDVDASDVHQESSEFMPLTWTQKLDTGDVRVDFPPITLNTEIGGLELFYTPQDENPAPVLEFDAEGNLTSVPDPIVGTIEWQWSVEDSALDFLGAGDELLVVYHVSATDNSGATAGVDFDESPTLTVPVEILVTGTNDLPVISDLASTFGVETTNELADDNPGSNDPTESQQRLTASAALEITEVDVADVLNGTTTGNATATWKYFDNGSGQFVTDTVDTTGDDRDTRFDALIDQATLNFTTSDPSDGDRKDDADSSNDFTELVYNYDTVTSSNSTGFVNLDFLGEGDVVVLTFPVEVADNEGGTDTTFITVTINNTNDVPVIDATNRESAPGEDGIFDEQVMSFDENDDPDSTRAEGVSPNNDVVYQPLSTQGALLVTDLDVGDILTGSTIGDATALWNGADASEDSRFVQLIANANLTFDETATSDGSQTSLHYTYDLGAIDTGMLTNLDFLGEGDLVELTYQVQVADNAEFDSDGVDTEGKGTTDTTFVTVRIVGTNDVPVFAGFDTTVLTEANDLNGAIGNGNLTPVSGLSGSIAFTDVDVTDTGHTFTVESVVSRRQNADELTTGLSNTGFIAGAFEPG